MDSDSTYVHIYRGEEERVLGKCKKYTMKYVNIWGCPNPSLTHTIRWICARSHLDEMAKGIKFHAFTKMNTSSPPRLTEPMVQAGISSTLRHGYVKKKK